MTKNPIFHTKTETKWKNKLLRLVSRSNQDGVSKLNTDPKLSETIINDRNSKEHTQNKVKRKELP